MRIKGRPKGWLSIEDHDFLDRRRISIAERRREREKEGKKGIIKKKE